MTQVITDKMTDYKIKDITLADFGRKEIEIAEKEMPGLMSLRDQVPGQQAPAGCQDHRFAAYDYSNGSTDRNPSSSGS